MVMEIYLLVVLSVDKRKQNMHLLCQKEIIEAVECVRSHLNAFLPACVSAALFAPRIFAARPGQKSPTALHDESSTDKDKEDSINYTTVDWREFMCNTWHLEPTLRLEVHQKYFIHTAKSLS